MPGNALGDGGDSGRVAGGEGRFRVDDAGERLRHAIQARVVGALHAVGRLERVDVRVGERRPERPVVLEGGDRVDQRGVEPRRAALAGDGARGLRPALLPEDLHRLRQAHHARERRDVFASQARRVALAVPVLVELADRAGGVLVEIDAARDLGAALAAHLLELAQAVATERDHGAQVARAGEQRGLGRDRAPEVAQRLGRAAEVGELVLALDRQLVGAVCRGGGRGVRRAAGVLEQQRVEQRGALPRVEAGRLRQAQADQAAALGVTHRLPAGDVQGVGERADDLRQADVHDRVIGRRVQRLKRPIALVACEECRL